MHQICWELKKIKNTRPKATNKYESSSENISISDSDSSLSSDSDLNEGHTYEHKEINILYNAVNSNLREKKCNDSIDYELKFDDKFSLPSDTPMYPLAVVTTSLREGKKNRANIISGLTCL